MKLLLHKNSRTLQHTCVSSGSCFTAGRPKFSCLTSADQSPLPDSVVHGPSVSLVSGTFSVNSLVWKSWVTSAGGRLVDSVSLLAIESVLSILHQLRIIQLHRQTQRFTVIRLYVALPRFCRDMTQGRDIVCHTVAGTHAGTYVPRLVLGLCTESDCFFRLNVDIFKLLSIVNWTVSKHERADDEMRFLWTLLVLVTLRWCDEVVAWCYTNKSMCSANQLHFLTASIKRLKILSDYFYL